MKSVKSRWRLSGSLIFVAITLFLAGCLNRRDALTRHVSPVQSASFKIVDQRPADERTSKWLSNIPYQCTFTVRQVGDDALSPDRLTLLSDSLNSRLHERLAGKTLLVTTFGIYINSSQRSRASELIRGDTLTQSLVDYAMGNRLEHLCRSEEVAEGWREAAEGPEAHSVVIVRITLTLEGETHRARVFFLPHRQIPADARAPETAAALSSAVEKASDQIAAELLARPRSELSQVSAPPPSH